MDTPKCPWSEHELAKYLAQWPNNRVLRFLPNPISSLDFGFVMCEVDFDNGKMLTIHTKKPQQ